VQSLRYGEILHDGYRSFNIKKIKDLFPNYKTTPITKWKHIWKITFKHWVTIFKTIDIKVTEQNFSNSRKQPKEYTPHRIPKTENTLQMKMVICQSEVKD